jgi:ketosteroid isomerase-like protein
MSQENLELVRGLFEMSHRGLDLLKMGTAPLELVYDRDVVFDLTDFEMEGMDYEYRGLDGARRFWKQVLAAWSGLEWEAEFFERDDIVVAVLDQHSRAEASGEEVHRIYAQMFRFRDSRIVFWKPYAEPADALRAAGIDAELPE